jgi:hypothetical protein
MTTPPTPAGWYPDPDGSAGQRYWDGSAWTEHRAPAAPPPPEPIGRVGAHRRPEAGDEPEATAQFEPGPTASVSQPTTPVVLPPEPAPPPAEPTPPPASAEPPSFEIPTAEAPSAEAPSGEAPAEPLSFGEPPEPPVSPPQAPSDGPSEPGDNRKLILRFGVACAALLAVLVLAIIYALFLHKGNTIQIGAPGASTSTAESTSKSASATSGSKSTKTQTESPTASGQASDGGLTFAVTNVETAPSVKYQDAPVVKKAQGEFLIVHMTVLNSGAEHTTFLGTLQKLKAGGSTYSIDDEATFYLNSGVADLNPGDTKDVAIAFDVPPGTTPDSIELHGDPISSGVEVPLS